MADCVRLDHRLEARDEASNYQRVEVITGRHRRRQWAAEEKARIVAESAASGANISEVARRNEVNRGLLTVWRRQAGIVDGPRVPEAVGFVPVEIDGEGAKETPRHDRGAGGRIELDLRTGRMVLSGGVDPELATAVIEATRRRG